MNFYTRCLIYPCQQPHITHAEICVFHFRKLLLVDNQSQTRPHTVSAQLVAGISLRDHFTKFQPILIA